MFAKFSVKKPYTVLVGVVLAIVLGIVSFTKMTTDLLPSMSLPYVIVMTTYPGASPETVETVVTRPVESAMATVSNIQSISSTSSENYSMVILEFAQSADMNAVSLEIRESLDQITSYWDDSIGDPIIMKLNPDMLPVMIAAVGVEGMEHAQISTYVEEVVMPELESIEGVASVSASGLLEESINVIIRPEKVDAVNEKIFAAIDKELQEAMDELEEGRQKLEEGKQELIDGKDEILTGQQELDNGKAELEDGKAELEKTKQETIEQLAKTKTELLTAKTNLESTKMTITTNLTTAQGLQSAIDGMTPLLEVSGKYSTAYNKLYPASVSGNDSVSGSNGGGLSASEEATLKAEIEALKKSYVENSTIQTIAAADASLSGVLKTLKDADWTSPNDHQTVTENMMVMDMLLGGTDYPFAGFCQWHDQRYGIQCIPGNDESDFSYYQ